MMMELCQRVLDGRGLLDVWQTGVLVPISKGKRGVRICNACRLPLQ